MCKVCKSNISPCLIGYGFGRMTNTSIQEDDAKWVIEFMSQEKQNISDIVLPHSSNNLVSVFDPTNYPLLSIPPIHLTQNSFLPKYITPHQWQKPSLVFWVRLGHATTSTKETNKCTACSTFIVGIFIIRIKRNFEYLWSMTDTLLISTPICTPITSYSCKGI